jgi:hypothetical protein
MRHLPTLTSMGVTPMGVAPMGIAPMGIATVRSGFMSAVSVAAALVGAPGAALAQVQTYYHAGVWDAFSGRNEKGAAVCGVGNTNPNDHRRIAIRRDIASGVTTVSVSKPGWSIPDNTRVPVVMQIGLNMPWTEQGTGHGQTIDWPLDPGIAQPFDRQFRSASSMTLTFPNGNEPPWTVLLAGSSAISDAFGRCVSDLTRQVQAEQAAGNVNPPPSGAAPGSTQPFAPAAGSPAAATPSPTQPVAAPPASTQPDTTQPDTTQPAH